MALMIVFETDRPTDSRASRSRPRLRRWPLGSLLVYPTWLGLLGPYWALDGSGTLDFLPDNVRRIVYLPAVPICYSPSVFAVFEGYLNWWHQDSNEAETTW